MSSTKKNERNQLENSESQNERISKNDVKRENRVD